MPRWTGMRRTIFARIFTARAISERRGARSLRGFPRGASLASSERIPERKGLLYAGTENAAYVSFDDGDHWSPLQLNMPTVSVRDLVVHGNDLVAATYGRAFWILDDITPLRQIDRGVATAAVHVFRPEKALRVRLDLNQDTPLPPEMPAGENPPNGAIVDYYLGSAPPEDIALAIYDSAGQLVRQFSSKPEAPSTEPPPNVPEYWLARPEALSRRAGMNRFVWDLRYTAPPAIRHEYPISALYGNTLGEPLGALAVPGRYEVRLTVDGRQYKQPLEVGMDPRVDVSTTALEQQFEMEKKVIELVAMSYEFHHRAALLREAAAVDEKKLGGAAATGPALAALRDFDGKAAKLEGSEGGDRSFGKPKPTFSLMNRELGSLATAIDSADVAPTPAMQTAYEDYCRDLTGLATRWNELVQGDLPKVNQQLAAQRLAALPASPAAAPACK